MNEDKCEPMGASFEFDAWVRIVRDGELSRGECLVVGQNVEIS